jgi:hypothetical protein
MVRLIQLLHLALEYITISENKTSQNLKHAYRGERPASPKLILNPWQTKDLTAGVDFEHNVAMYPCRSDKWIGVPASRCTGRPFEATWRKPASPSLSE